MSRKSQTIGTFAVTIKVPIGSNLAIVQTYIRDAIQSHCGGLDPKDEMFGLDPKDFTVALTKKVTTYGGIA